MSARQPQGMRGRPAGLAVAAGCGGNEQATCSCGVPNPQLIAHPLSIPLNPLPARSYYLDSKQKGAAAGAEDEEEAAPPARQPARPVDAAELLREAEEAAGDAGMEMLDARGLKRLTLALERKVGAWRVLKELGPGCCDAACMHVVARRGGGAWCCIAPPSFHLACSTTPTWRPA